MQGIKTTVEIDVPDGMMDNPATGSDVRTLPIVMMAAAFAVCSWAVNEKKKRTA